MNKEEMLKIAHDVGVWREHTNTYMATSEELMDFANAIIELAAVECERSEMYRGSIFAARIRKLKEPQ